MDTPAVASRALPAAATVVTVTLAAWLAPLALPGDLPSAISVLGVDPLRWLAPAAVAAWLMGDRRRLLFADGARWAPTAACVAVAHVGVLVIAGLVFGMGRSPWSHSLAGLLTLAWTTPLMLAGAEVTRAYLVRTLRGPAATAVPWLLLLVAGLSLAAPAQFDDPANGIRYLGEVVLPAAGIGLLATVLAQRGGAGAALAYVGPLAAFERLSPILPDLPWAVAALVGMLVPVLGLHLLDAAAEADTTAEAERTTIDSRGQQRRSDAPYLVAAILAGAIVALNTGVLGVTPAVIHGISMEPTMHEGDIVLARQAPPESLAVGDVVSFHQRGRTVVHRIVGINTQGGAPVFTTLGDNNEAPDSPVPAKALIGRVVLHLREAGRPILWTQLVDPARRDCGAPLTMSAQALVRARRLAPVALTAMLLPATMPGASASFTRRLGVAADVSVIPDSTAAPLAAQETSGPPAAPVSGGLPTGPPKGLTEPVTVPRPGEPPGTESPIGAAPAGERPPSAPEEAPGSGGQGDDARTTCPPTGCAGYGNPSPAPPPTAGLDAGDAPPPTPAASPSPGDTAAASQSESPQTPAMPQEATPPDEGT